MTMDQAGEYRRAHFVVERAQRVEADARSYRLPLAKLLPENRTTSRRHGGHLTPTLPYLAIDSLLHPPHPFYGGGVIVCSKMIP
jgi:hypothetical protein